MVWGLLTINVHLALCPQVVVWSMALPQSVCMHYLQLVPHFKDAALNIRQLLQDVA